jgi:hypothetical protein
MLRQLIVLKIAQEMVYAIIVFALVIQIFMEMIAL